jgi:FAD/FMN-containing dehydrogenase
MHDEVTAAVRGASGVRPEGGRPFRAATAGIAAPLREGGGLIGTSAFTSILIDAQVRTARIGPAARGGDVARALAAQGILLRLGALRAPVGGGLGLN